MVFNFIFLFILAPFFGNLSSTDSDMDVKWISWEEAVELNAAAPKKIFIDVYTDWCGWCKRMDKTTFKDPEVMKSLNGSFYAVKLNAEQKEDIIFQGNTFKFVKSGRRGSHQLAQALLNGKMGYPSFVILDEEFKRIMISPGFKTPDKLLTELKFAKEEKYKEMSWEQYQNTPK